MQANIFIKNYEKSFLFRIFTLDALWLAEGARECALLRFFLNFFSNIVSLLSDVVASCVVRFLVVSAQNSFGPVRFGPIRSSNGFNTFL